MKHETLLKTPLIDPETIEPYTSKPRFETSNKGVFYVKVKVSDNDIKEEPILLSDPMDIIGRGIDESGAYFTIISYTDRQTRHRKNVAISNAEIGTPSCWQRLQGLGITIYSGKQKREWLADYLQTKKTNTYFDVVNTSGWHNGAYVLPNGEIISPNTSEPPRIIYNGDKSQANAYKPSGSLKEWQESIAKYASGNSRLCLALGTAFAAPFISRLKLESGGFHLQGKSRGGKSTAARVALSVWSNHQESFVTWQGTGLGFNNLATARNDGLLVLDEISQAAPKVVSSTVYSVMNGINKAQGAKDGGNRTISRWRVFVLSTGELTPETMLHNKAEWNAGQAVRLPTIAADAGKGFGVYDTLHDFKSGAELSEYLNYATAEYCGTAGREFIKLINDQANATIRGYVADFMAMLPDLTNSRNGQARTVALRFALAAAALEFAAPVTGLAAGVGMAGIKQCFDDWLESNGTGNREDLKILHNFIDFMDKYAHSDRFSRLDSQFTNHNHAGFIDDTMQPIEYFIIPAVFQAEIVQAFGLSQVLEILSEKGCFIKGNRGKGQTQKTYKGLKKDYYRCRDYQADDEE